MRTKLYLGMVAVGTMLASTPAVMAQVPASWQADIGLQLSQIVGGLGLSHKARA